VAELNLARFIEDLVVPPKMIDTIVDGEVNEEYVKTLQMLSKKLKYVEVDPIARKSAALKDVEPELERLRQKAVSKGIDFIVQKLQALKKPKTNIQILQQNVLLKYKYVAAFLKEHGKEVYHDVRVAYIDTLNKVLSAHFRAYIQALEKLQLDIASANDLIGIDARSTSLFSRAREPLKNRSAVFVLGDRVNILKDIDQPALIPHIAEASGAKYPYEVLFRSLHKLLMDTATSEYLFCHNFFGEDAIFYEIFLGPFAVIDEHFNAILPNFFDAIGLMLMIRITHQHQLIMSRRRIPCLDSYLDKVNISLWPRFKMVFDMHLSSLRNANVRTLWEDDAHPHYVMRRYAEFTASLLQLNVDYGDGQLELNLDRLRVAVDDLLVKLARMFSKPKQQTIFLINNYDMILAVLKEAGVEGGKTQLQFDELLKSNTTVFVEELLLEHFKDLIRFVKTRAGEEANSTSERPVTVEEVEPLVKDFAIRWKGTIELMHRDVIRSFSNLLCGMEILKAALTQLLLYYTRLSDCIKRIGGSSALNKELVSISSIMYEIKKEPDLLWQISSGMLSADDLQILQGNKENLFGVWRPPEEGWIQLNFDGASRDNPSKAGCGCIFRDFKCQLILALVVDCGVSSNNVEDGMELRFGLMEFISMVLDGSAKAGPSRKRKGDLTDKAAGESFSTWMDLKIQNTAMKGWLEKVCLVAERKQKNERFRDALKESGNKPEDKERYEDYSIIKMNGSRVSTKNISQEEKTEGKEPPQAKNPQIQNKKGATESEKSPVEDMACLGLKALKKLCPNGVDRKHEEHRKIRVAR
ncbi:hypothetical protein KI387_008667, partial [Taxus chinensis]